VVGLAETHERRRQGRALAAGGATGGAADGAAGTLFGALDLGTNNCRLLVAKRAPGGFRVVDAFSRIVRLGEGLSRDNHLGEAAMARAIEALQVCATKLDRRQRVIFRGVAAETGLDLAAIQPAEEAALAVAGCAQLLDPTAPNAIMFDIGGGSTEVMWLANRRSDSENSGWALVDFVSLPFGVISVGERLGGAQVAPLVYDAAVADIVAALGALDQRCAITEAVAAGKVDMLGTSGTVTTLSALAQGLKHYQRDRVDGSALAAADIRTISKTLADSDFATRAEHPCIGHERADLVVAGCAILEAICRLWPVPVVRVADRGLREGILLGLMAAEAGAP
jgi:exopolyphosphatase / guanosine-5'-triphosphate,3'-diphosphate pyrophosphatase